MALAAPEHGSIQNVRLDFGLIGGMIGIEGTGREMVLLSIVRRRSHNMHPSYVLYRFRFRHSWSRQRAEGGCNCLAPSRALWLGSARDVSVL